MTNEEPNLSGFLAGSPEMPLHWRQVLLSSEPTEREWISIHYFQLRAKEFLLNLEDLSLSSRHMLDIDSSGKRTAIRADMYPNRHRAKSLYLDFRHFTAKKEPSNFDKVTNIVMRRTLGDEIIAQFLRQEKLRFADDATNGIQIGSRPLRVMEVVDLWFNTEMFHAGTLDQRKKREALLRTLADGAPHHFMFWGIVNAAYPVKCLYACIRNLTAEVLSVNCPDERIIPRHSKNAGR